MSDTDPNALLSAHSQIDQEEIERLFLELRGSYPRSLEDEPLLRYFKFQHLPETLKPISQDCHDLAKKMARDLQGTKDQSEFQAGLRKLLEAKDCFVRAKLACSKE